MDYHENDFKNLYHYACNSHFLWKEVLNSKSFFLNYELKINYGTKKTVKYSNTKNVSRNASQMKFNNVNKWLSVLEVQKNPAMNVSFMLEFLSIYCLIQM